MRKLFPDEASMPRSEKGDEPIRGGSVGLNRILGRFVIRSTTDHFPEFRAILINAKTIFRNVWTNDKKSIIEKWEEAFMIDLTLLMDYYDIYLSHVGGRSITQGHYPIVVYFPTYSKTVPKEILREAVGQTLEMENAWNLFYKRYIGSDSKIRTLENTVMYWVRAGDTSYPHIDASRKLRDISYDAQCLYRMGDPCALISSVMLDFHLTKRLRNVGLLESYTGEYKQANDLRYRLDKHGHVPFTSTTHVVMGDKSMIKPMISGKMRTTLLATAEKDRWISRSDVDVMMRISKIINVNPAILRKYDFT